MREVIVRFIQDERTHKFRVEVEWSPPSKIEVEDMAVEVFKPVLDMSIRAILPKETGYGEGDTMEKATQRAFIERDISAASRKEEP